MTQSRQHYLNQVKLPLAIDDIIDAETKAAAICVKVTATGRPAWIPRSVKPEFYPGLVYIPAWLYQRINPTT